MSAPRIQSFAEFWPFYLGEHSLPTTRWLHFSGTSLALVMAIIAVATGTWWLLPIALSQGYGWSWVGHFFVEKNKPASFTYPLWSFAGDWKMWSMMGTGRLGAELTRLNITPKVVDAQPLPSK